MCVSRIKSVDQNILSRAEPVRHGHEIRPVGRFLDGHPPFQRRQLHDLIPELLVFCDRQIQLGQYAAEIKAVARSAVRCNAECHIFCVGEHTALACRVFRKLSSGMAAGRADHKDGADIVMNSVRLRDCDGSLQIDINIINPLTDITDEEDIIKVMFIDPPEILDEAIAKLPAWIKEDFNVFKSAPFFLEITHKDVDKGAGLLHLADYLNIKQSETMACGDQGNDYTMIKAAGLGVAMENGIDKVKAIADYVTDTNDNDGVAKAIEKFVLNK